MATDRSRTSTRAIGSAVSESPTGRRDPNGPRDLADDANVAADVQQQPLNATPATEGDIARRGR